MKTARRRQVKAKPEIVDGHRFASANEAERFRATRDRAHEIRHIGDGQGLAIFEHRSVPDGVWQTEAFKAAPVKRSKYRNVLTTVDGITFHSAAEARRYSRLTLLARAKRIDNLQRQVPFELVVSGVKVARYIADFTYDELLPSGTVSVVEDVKGYVTTEYAMKRALMLACYGITIREIR